jgi:hypothetical protein
VPILYLLAGRRTQALEDLEHASLQREQIKRKRRGTSPRRSAFEFAWFLFLIFVATGFLFSRSAFEFGSFLFLIPRRAALQSP